MIPKFRLFDKNTKEWQSIRSIGLEEDGSILYVQCWDKHEVDIDPPYFIDNLGIDFELMQSTGLRDRNGKEIFEGDIVKSKDGWISEVYYEKSSVSFRVKKGLLYLSAGSWVSYFDGEVLGNIHEHSYFLYKNEKGDY